MLEDASRSRWFDDLFGDRWRDDDAHCSADDGHSGDDGRSLAALAGAGALDAHYVALSALDALVCDARCADHRRRSGRCLVAAALGHCSSRLEFDSASGLVDSSSA